MALRSSCLSSVLAIGTLSALHTQALASPAPATESLAETEVIVTARKIEERPQDVPISVQVLSGEYLDESGVNAIARTAVRHSGPRGQHYRHVRRRLLLARNRGPASPALSVAPHLNGVYLGDANVAIARMFDIERIEVLKGPQGTLYGRNATGGSINVITQPPQDSLASEIEVSLGTFDTTRAQGLSQPAPVETAAVRLAFIASNSDGYIRNSVDERRFAEDDYWGLRGSLRIDFEMTLRVDVMAQHIRDDGGSGELWTPSPDFLVDPHDIRLTTVTLENPYLISEIDNLNVNLEYDLGYASLRSITGYARSKVRNVDDCAGLPVLQGCVRSALPHRIRPVEPGTPAGVSPVRRNRRHRGRVLLRCRYVRGFYQLLPLVNSQPLNDNHSTTSDPTSAVFGQATVHFADRWSATAGLRMSREKQRVTTVGTGYQDSQTLLVGKRESDDPSWLLAIDYASSDELMFYASVRRGTRAEDSSTRRSSTASQTTSDRST